MLSLLLTLVNITRLVKILLGIKVLLVLLLTLVKDMDLAKVQLLVGFPNYKALVVPSSPLSIVAIQLSILVVVLLQLAFPDPEKLTAKQDMLVTYLNPVWVLGLVGMD